MTRESSVFVWPDRALFLGDRSETALHAHNAVEVDVSLDDSGIDMVGEDGTAISAPGIIVRSDAPHQLSIPGPKVAILYIEPTSPAGVALREHLGERDLAALPAVTVREVRPHMLALFEGGGLAEAHVACERLLSDIAPEPGRPTIDWRVRKVLSFLGEHLDDPPPLAIVAAKVQLSESRLSHVFKEQIGVPVRRYVLWLRLRRALVSALGGASMTEAAHEAGFSDTAHFSRTCQRMFGLPPTAFSPVDAVFVA